MKNVIVVVAVFAVLAVLGVANPAVAYVGPGAGLSLLGALWGLLLAIVAALGFVILWPLRRMLKRNRAAAAAGSGASPGRPAAEPAHDGSSSRTGSS